MFTRARIFGSRVGGCTADLLHGQATSNVFAITPMGASGEHVDIRPLGGPTWLKQLIVRRKRMPKQSACSPQASRIEEHKSFKNGVPEPLACDSIVHSQTSYIHGEQDGEKRGARGKKYKAISGGSSCPKVTPGAIGM